MKKNNLTAWGLATIAIALGYVGSSEVGQLYDTVRGHETVQTESPVRDAIEERAWQAFDASGIRPDGVRVFFVESSPLALKARPGSYVVTDSSGTYYRFGTSNY